MSITIIQGDLLEQDVDAIVNPANGFLMHGAGLARVIDQAARGFDDRFGGSYGFTSKGDRINLYADQNKAAPTIATGDVHVTSAGCLPFKGIIHAVGPVYKDGTLCEHDLLELVHESVLTVCEFNDWHSVAIPAISCGLFRFPVEEAAPIAVIVASWFPHIDVTFALFEDSHFAAYGKAAIESTVPYRIVKPSA